MSKLNDSIGSARHDFSDDAFLEKHLLDSPFLLFNNWLSLALNENIKDYNSMVLSTLFNKKPKSRVVLLREVTDHGFVFYTNYKSQKAIEIEQNQNACVNFFWPQLNKQVRAEGVVRKVSGDKSDAYFASRPKKSQLSTLASHQSTVLESRAILSEKFNTLSDQFRHQKVKRPPYWGGYELVVDYFEFWQGRPSRMHDRLAYSLKGPDWQTFRLSP